MHVFTCSVLYLSRASQQEPTATCLPLCLLRYEARRAGTWSERSRRSDLSETNGRGERAGSYKQHERREDLEGGRRRGNGIRATCGCEEGPPVSSCDGMERKKRSGEVRASCHPQLQPNTKGRS